MLLHSLSVGCWGSQLFGVKSFLQDRLSSFHLTSMVPDCQKHVKNLQRIVGFASSINLMDWVIDLQYSGGRCYISTRLIKPHLEKTCLLGFLTRSEKTAYAATETSKPLRISV